MPDDPKAPEAHKAAAPAGPPDQAPPADLAPPAFLTAWLAQSHDLLAMTKRKAARVEGNLLPFMQHLQYVKDVLAAPRAGI